MPRLRQLLLITLIAGIFLAACGGGGGGGDSATSDYTGLKTPAAITQANADELATEALSAGVEDFVADDILLGVETATDVASTPLPHTIIFTQVLTEQVKKLNLDGSSFLPGVTQTETFTEACDGGGTVTITFTADDVTGNFSGSMRFTDCVFSDATLSGSISFSGVIDTIAQNSIQMTMTFTALTQEYGSESYTMNGRVEISISDLSTSTGSQVTTVMNYTLRDNTTGTVVMLENYRVVATDLVTEVRITVSGKFYHPDYGYIVITTTEPMLIRYENDWPYSGQYVIDGDNSSLRVTALNSTQYTLELDEDGDGIYETVTTETW